MTESAPSPPAATSAEAGAGVLAGMADSTSSENPILPEFILTWKQRTKYYWRGGVSYSNDNIVSIQRIHWIHKPFEFLHANGEDIMSFNIYPPDIQNSEPEYIHCKYQYGRQGSEPPFFDVRIVLMPSEPHAPLWEIYSNVEAEWKQPSGDDWYGTIVYWGIEVPGHSRFACVARRVGGKASKLALDITIESRDDDEAQAPADLPE